MAPPQSILLGLTRRYCEPHRRYHTIRHIADLLWRGRELDLDDEQVLAIWYHDAIYDVPGDDNERRSAALAVTELRALGWPEPGVRKVERIVLDTEQHTPSIDAARIVLDLDLASLGDDWDTFLQNNRAIRAEYSIYDNAEFAAGQRRVLERFLARDRIYFTPWGAAHEATARRNIERCLNS